MRRYLFAVLAALLVGAFVFPTAAFAGKPAKVAACHFEEDEQEEEGATWELQLVSEKALPSLLEADDGEWGVPGGEVPGMEDYEFGEDCSLVLAVMDADLDGVPDDEDNCPAIANTDQSDRYGSADGDACEDSNGDGTFDVDETDICVEVNDVLIHSSATTTSTCGTQVSTGSAANVAIAHDGARAIAHGGAGNTATATGLDARANAGDGNDNTATATGDGARATAIIGDGNTVTAYDGGTADAILGNGNTATATGTLTFASAGNGDNNTATATGTGDLTAASAGNGDNNTATATSTTTGGDFTFASATAPFGCTAEATNGEQIFCP